MPQTTPPKDALLDAILPHVAFDGWSQTSFDMAARDAGLDATVARAVCPRGAVDLAVAYHKRGDDLMLAQFAAADLTGMRYRDKILALVRMRLEVVEDKEVVRKASAMFALPKYTVEGGKLIWGTCDAIWNALGDTSDDINWYTKRATLSGVYGSCVLFWLGDESDGNTETWEFLERRIENVMQFEKFKAGMRNRPFFMGLAAAPTWAMSFIKAPRADVSGRTNTNESSPK